MKLMIMGYARHGKDTVAEMFKEFLGLTFKSSSYMVADLLREDIERDLGLMYFSLNECYQDRVNRRQYWHEWIIKYNSKDPARLSREIFNKYDMYVGIRNPIEFYAAKELFNLSIWVDAPKRQPTESTLSNKMTKNMADIIIDNNGTFGELKTKIRNLTRVLK